MSLRPLLVTLAALALTGCPTGGSDAPPPAAKPEIAAAPPRALGALAAGTDAAPRPERVLGGDLPSLPLPPGHGHLPGAGAGGTGSGAPAPGAPGGLAPAEPDAGMAL